MKERFVLALFLAGFYMVAAASAIVKHSPRPVDFAAEKAEDVIDYFQSGDWQKAAIVVDSIADNQYAVDSLMEQNAMPQFTSDTFDYLLFRLQGLTKNQTDSIQAALIANQITDIMIDLQMKYQEPLPPEISRLDYLGREIILLAESKNNYGLLDKRISQIREIWQRLRGDIIKRNGLEIALRLDKTLESLNAQEPANLLIEKGNNILDMVDELEALYK